VKQARTGSTLWLVIAGSLVLSRTAVATSEVFAFQEVGETKTYSFCTDANEDGVCEPGSYRTAPSCAVTSWPAGGVSAPIVNSACPVHYDSTTNIWAIDYSLKFSSAKDVGDWTVTCTDRSASVDTCTPAACGLSCPSSAPAPRPAVIHVRVTPKRPPPPTVTINAPFQALHPPERFELLANAHLNGDEVPTYTWSLVSRPSATAPVPAYWSTTNPQHEASHDPGVDLYFADERSIGTWVYAVAVVDQYGQRATAQYSFTLQNNPPYFNGEIAGARTIDALQPLALAAAAFDDDNQPSSPPPAVHWDLVASPLGSDRQPRQDFFVGTNLSLPTTDRDIGIWTFKVRSVDNEGEWSNRTSGYPDWRPIQPATVEVRNLPPRISFTGAKQIKVGETIKVATSITSDDDGGALTYQWDVVQAPASAPANLKLATRISSASSIALPTNASYAGTWIFRLTVTDNDNADNSTVHDDYPVLVDAPPVADVTGPAYINAVKFPLVLDSSGSIDPDSPCPDEINQCHVTVRPPVVVSGGIKKWSWSVVEVPPNLLGRYAPGPVSDVLFEPGNQPSLTIDYSHIDPGQWKFRLEITDEENNTDTVDHTVVITEPNAHPIAILSPPASYIVGGDGRLASAITVDGSYSYDPDNIFGSQPSNGLGITAYQWSVTPPPGCTGTAPPPGAIGVLYAAGAIVPPECQGAWTLTLVVTDDDSPALTGANQTTVLIGNCKGSICIDRPTAGAPQVFSTAVGMKAVVYYHIDSAFYDDPRYANGVSTMLKIFPHGQTAPAYSVLDSNLFIAGKGVVLSFAWNGFDSQSKRVPAGTYDVELDLLDSLLANIAATRENGALVIGGTTALVTMPAFVNGTRFGQGATVPATCKLAGTSAANTVVWRVRDTAGNVVYSSTVGASSSLLTLSWNGLIGTSPAPAGDYTTEAEVLSGARSMAVSQPVKFTIYRWTFTPAVPQTGQVRLFVNDDDDDHDGRPDNTTAQVAGDDDLLPVNVTLAPALSGTLTLNETGAAGATATWTDASKSTALSLPTTAKGDSAQVVLEGMSPGLPKLVASFTTADGVALESETLVLDVARLEILLGYPPPLTATPTTFLRIANWENACKANCTADSTSLPELLNGPGDANLVNQDPRNFFVRVTDPGANLNPTQAEALSFNLATLLESGALDDDPTGEGLLETGPNTGVFTSVPQLLVTDDIFPNPDDQLLVNDGFGNYPPDDTFGDRTHRVGMDGSVRVTVGTDSAHRFEVPVCNRWPDERRVVRLRVHTFLEPFLDTGLAVAPFTNTPGRFDYYDRNGNGRHDPGEPSEPYVDLSQGTYGYIRGEGGAGDGRGPVESPEQIANELWRADISFSPACIRFELAGPILVEHAPLNSVGADILSDGLVTIPDDDPVTNDALSLYAAYADRFTPDALDIFWAGRMRNADIKEYWGLSFVDSGDLRSTEPLRGEFALLEPDVSFGDRVLAHELGHLLTTWADEKSPRWVFFPQDGISAPDTNALTTRRLGPGAVDAARASVYAKPYGK
jgi:hypothetical protein